MVSLKDTIKAACIKQNMSLSKVLMNSKIQSGDFYQAVNGKKPFFEGWKKRIAETLNLSVEELFPANEKEDD